MPLGRIHALYLFDVGDAIDLQALPSLVGATTAAPLSSKPASPPYLQYQQPPVSIDGATLGLSAGDHRVRFRLYDYGVVSVTMLAPLPERWEDMLDLGSQWQDNARILSQAEQCCRELLRRIGLAVTAPRASFLWED